jgi:hypothetical protein
MFSTLALGQSSHKWQQVYSDEDVKIYLDKSNVVLKTDDIAEVTFRWIWAKPRELKMTPGVSYKSRIEVTEIDCARRMYHTTINTKLFDDHGAEIKFDRVVPSPKWDKVDPESISGQIFDPACELVNKKRK